MCVLERARAEHPRRSDVESPVSRPGPVVAAFGLHAAATFGLATRDRAHYAATCVAFLSLPGASFAAVRALPCEGFGGGVRTLVSSQYLARRLQVSGVTSLVFTTTWGAART